MDQYDLVLSKPRVAEAMRRLDPADRREARRLFNIIRLDPSIDNRNKIFLPRPPVVYYAYVTERLWIVYHVFINKITVCNVGLASVSAPIP